MPEKYCEAIAKVCKLWQDGWSEKKGALPTLFLQYSDCRYHVELYFWYRITNYINFIFSWGKSEENTLVLEKNYLSFSPPLSLWPINMSLLTFCPRDRKPKHPTFLFYLQIGHSDKLYLLLKWQFKVLLEWVHACVCRNGMRENNDLNTIVLLKLIYFCRVFSSMLFYQVQSNPMW